MTKIPLAASDRRRRALREPDVLMRNRYVEPNPVLSDGGPSYPARPALRWWQRINGGIGPIRGVFQQPGAFNDDLFAVAFNSLYRVDRITGVPTLLTNQLFGDDKGVVRMTATGDVGTVGPHLFVSDGESLLCYMENGFATGHLNFTAQAADGDVVRIGSVYYRFSTGSLDSGAPAGTLANPWRVLIGPATVLQTITNLFNAINATGVAGTDYSTALIVASPDAVGMRAVAQDLYVHATATGAFGNSTATTTTGATMSWINGATMINGGVPGIINVPLPDGVGVIDVAMINSFVIVIPAQGAGINGRFYWIEPAAVVIDPLNFATAERSADPVYQCVVFNDNFWLPGQNSNEVWYMSGDANAPVQRQQGIVFDRGVVPGGAIKVLDSMVIISSDGAVLQIQGGEKRISTPDIEERLRKAINYSNIYNSL